ncbi:GIY-YIG nuclease family protein [Enterococcus asini]|uniref:GIY-YIG nuclease family protein n=1 Tax=Enterococcus asini TaxID=57732 RepID=UPI000E48A775|nr:GIY-YIG nuclease family protein [Enterococcus asini]RGW12309.1 hypothetical protein DWV91_10260 [Enterococcus asini]
MKTLQEKLRDLPDKPGIYLMKDLHGDIFYVGKAKNLKNRVRSYFHHNGQHSKKVQRMVFNIHDLEYHTVDTELDALLLECRLIQKYHPYYNRMMNAQQNYAYVLVQEAHLQVLAEVPENIPTNSQLLGPFRQYKQLPHLVQLLTDTYLLPDVNYVTRLAVSRQLPEMPERLLTEKKAQILGFWQGGKTDFLTLLDQRIASLAAQLNFESAQQLQELATSAHYFYEQQQRMNAFQAIPQQLFALPLTTRRKKLYQISYGQLVATEILPLKAAESFTATPLSAPLSLTKTDIDPLLILMSYLEHHKKHD